MSRSFEEKLALYAQLAVRTGVNVQPGQELLISADVADVRLVRLIVAEAYRAGAKNVLVLFGDEPNTLARFEHGSDAAMEYAPQWLMDGLERAMKENAARLSVFGGNPALLKDVDPQRIAGFSVVQAKAAENLGKMIGGFAINWSIIGVPSPAWAKMVFPNESEAVAVEKLWDAIFMTCRIDQPDPVAAWTANQDECTARAAWLTGLGIDQLHYRGPGTDLTVGLARETRWMGGWAHAQNGVKCSPNVPTEEVFTVPDNRRCEGFISSTKPLSLRGQIIDGIRVEFSGGEVVKASAKAGEETFLNLLQTDDGARRLGEVALVPASGPIARTGLLFFNTLYDENAACHIALGRMIDACFTRNAELDDAGRTALGGNTSTVHVDWMVGSAELDVDGILADGSKVAILRQGEWAAPIG
jgi:aminopeptidase